MYKANKLSCFWLIIWPSVTKKNGFYFLGMTVSPFLID